MKVELVKPAKSKREIKVTPSQRKKMLAELLAENGRNGVAMSMYEAMLKVGYSENYAKSSTKMRETKSWQDLMDEMIPDSLVMETHQGLMKATTLDHMTFGIGFRNEVEKEKFIEELEYKYKNAKDESVDDEDDEDLDDEDEDRPRKKKKAAKKGKTKAEIQKDLSRKIALAKETLTDTDIKEMLASVNCTVKRIVHQEMSRQVYYWSPDNRARKDAIEMAHKLKGSYAPVKVKGEFEHKAIVGMKIVLDTGK